MSDVSSLLESRASECAERIYLVSPGQELTFSEVNQRVDRFAARLAGLELVAGDRAGTAGEIVIRNLAMMKGYYENPQETAHVLPAGWLHTGDRGLMDERGLLYFLGRMKGVIRKKGENVSAVEVETVLLAHPSVDDAAVLGVETADSAGEDEIQACVVWRPGCEQVWEVLIAHCSETLADFKVPRLWQAWSELPKNSLNRVVKAKLKERAPDSGPIYDRRRK